MNGTQNQNLLYLESLCQELYSSKSQEQRAKAEKLLDNAFPTFSEALSPRTNGSNAMPNNPLGIKIQSPAESSMYCQWLLENSTSPYSQLFASARLKSLVLDHYSMFTAKQKLELRSFLFNYLAVHPDYQPFVLSSLAQLFATITKVGWFEDDEFKNITNELSKFIQSTVDHRIVGLQVLSTIVSEMNQQTPRNMARQRKTAIGFRDSQLLDIFRLGLVVLRQILNGETVFTNERKVKEYCLTLLRNCLAFDFIGTTPDESGEDVGSIQVSSSWRSTIEDPTFLQTIFEAYKRFQPPHSSQVMEVLVQISSIRRSLFNEEERSKFLHALMQGISEIIISSIGLSDLNNYHEFCRLLSRFRSTYQWNEITEKSGYSDWIDFVADFTIKGFNSWQFVPNSVQYLLTFWSKMYSSAGRSRPGSPNKLNMISSKLTAAYISSKIQSVEQILDGSIDDPLENEDALMDDLEMFSNIARNKYDESQKSINDVFQPIFNQYKELYTQVNVGIVNSSYTQFFDTIETKFAWLMYMIGGMIGGRQTYISTEDQDLIDGELTCQILQLMNMNEQWNAPRTSGSGYEKFELALVYFFQQFRKSYIGESAQRVSKVYSKLSDIGYNDQSMLLNAIIQRIAKNLEGWGHSSKIIQRSVSLFNDLAGGYSSVRILRKLDIVQYILRNHTIKNFPFLDTSNNLRSRMVYYSALSRILFAEDNVERDFEDFVKPWDITLTELGAFNSLNAFRQPTVKATISGIFRDLRGFLSAIQSKKNFLVFFEWFYPQYVPILYHALEAWDNDPLAITILKFFLEFVSNRQQRLNFDISSPNGILLFRETSKVISTYGRQIIGRPFNSQDKYAEKYKGISICFNILTKSFAGRYVNFGVFELYGDKALEIVLNTSFEMMLCVPFDDILMYPKLSKTFYDWLDTFTNEHMMALHNMDSNAFLYIMPNFNAVLFEESQNQWSLSRPLLCLILLNPDYWEQYTRNLVLCQLLERRDVLAKALTSLMQDVEFNLISKNRDRFTQNLTTFKRELTNDNVILVAPPMDMKMTM
ncbi:8336_t:CDS:10 [Funneliformis geosporum]|nr:8336_t:CDS:10 [Funneliformis geosporum]